MSQTYYTLVTNLGAALLAQATTLGTKLKLTHVAVGDGNGNLPSPSVTQKKLVNEKRRGAINAIYVDSDNANQIIIEQVIPPEEGGFYIREIGLFDENNNLIAVGNCPPSYKPVLSEGSGRTQVINMVIIVDNTGSVQLKIDASSVVATRKYVDDLITTKMKTHEESINHPTATTSKKGMVQLDSSTNSTSENKAATPKAVKTAYDLAGAALPKSGGTVTNEIVSTSYNALRLKNISQDISTILRFDGGRMWFLLTDKGDADGNFNSLRPFCINVETGVVTIGHDLMIGGLRALKQGDGGILSSATLNNNPDSTATKTGFYRYSGSPTLKPNGFANYGYYIKTSWASGTSESEFEANFIFQQINSPKIAVGYTNKETKDIEFAEIITESNLSNYIPVGIPQPWPTTTIPSGWLKCNGATFDKTLYPKLAVAYPTGKLPDLRGEFIRGFDDGRGIDSGRTILSNQAQQITKHKHIAPYAENTNSTNNFAPFGNSKSNAYHGSNGTDKDNYYFYTNDGSNDTDWPDLNIDGLIGSETRPRNIAFLYIVKAE